MSGQKVTITRLWHGTKTAAVNFDSVGQESSEERYFQNEVGTLSVFLRD